MMKTYAFAFLSFIGLLTGCADELETEPAVVPRIEYRIDGVSAEEFYSQFILRSLNECGSAKSFMVMGGPPVRIAVNQFGQDVTAQLTLMLGADRRYALLYQETQVMVAAGGLIRRPVTQTQVLKGAWRVTEDRLVLSGLAVGAGGRHDGRAKVQLQLRRNILAVGLEGREFLLIPTAATALFAPEMDPCQSARP